MRTPKQVNVIDFDLNLLADNWLAPVVARTEKDLRDFAGGGLPSKGTMANLDSLGEGPLRFRIGKKVVYPVDTLIEWMKQRQYKEPNQHLGEDGKWAKDSELEDQDEATYQTTSQERESVGVVSIKTGSHQGELRNNHTDTKGDQNS